MKAKSLIGITIAIVCLCMVAGMVYQNKIDYAHRVDLANQARQVGLLGFRDTVQKHPTDVNARIQLADWYIVTGKSEKAIAQFRTVLSQQPDNRRAKYQLAGLLEQVGKRDEAKQAYQELAQTNDKFGQAAKKHF